MKILTSLCALVCLLGGLALAAQDGSLELSVLCNGQPCPSEGAIIAVAAGTEIQFAISNPDNQFVSAYWVFGDGTTQEGGLVAKHRYQSAGKFTFRVYAFSLASPPASHTITILAAKNGNSGANILNVNDEMLQKVTLWVGAISAILALVYQLFIPPR